MRSKLISCLIFAGALLAPTFALAYVEATVVYVTRHGEKAAEAKDPDLTPRGQARARTLAVMLGKAGIRHVFSSATKRTRQTAQPLATQAGLEVQLYDAAKPAIVVDKIKSLPGPTLLVGHSNTVPDLVKMLGGAPGTPIGDEEYDRLYQVTIGADGKVSTVLFTSVVAD